MCEGSGLADPDLRGATHAAPMSNTVYVETGLRLQALNIQANRISSISANQPESSIEKKIGD